MDMTIDQFIKQGGLGKPARSLPVKSRKNSAPPIIVSGTRELSPADLDKLNQPKGKDYQTIKELRPQHHRIARLIAKGEKISVVRAVTGYSSSHISLLLQSPSFKELVDFYKSRVSAQFDIVVERLQALTGAGTEELLARLEEDPDMFSNAELIKLTEGMLDRTGHGKTSTVNVNQATLDITRIMELKAAVNLKERGKVIELSPDKETEMGQTSGGHSAGQITGSPKQDGRGIEKAGLSVREQDREVLEADVSEPGNNLGTVVPIRGRERSRVLSNRPLRDNSPQPSDTVRVQEDTVSGSISSDERPVCAGTEKDISTSSDNIDGL
jgi:hypothetical protein